MKNCHCGKNCETGVRKPGFGFVFLWIGIVALLSLVFSCKGNDPDQKNYDRQALVNHYSSNIIRPSFASLKTKVDSLTAAVNAFVTLSDNSNLAASRQALRQAWMQWQYCSFFEFGPSESRQLRANLNTFPTDTVKIQTNIQAGSWDLDQVVNLSAKGFPALDFLLWGTDSTAVLSLFSGGGASLRKNYLSALAADIQSRVDYVNQEWTAAFSASFTSSLGTDVGSSTGLLVNQYNYDLDLMKNAQVGIPLGKKTLGVPIPEKCEAFYGGFSLDLLKAHAAALHAYFKGSSFPSGTDGYGLYEVLEDIEAHTSSNTSLAAAIDAEYQELENSLTAIPDPFSSAVLNSAPLVDTAYAHIQQLLMWNKSDMASAMGILITYQDADGD